jgi:hypothetical protein
MPVIVAAWEVEIRQFEISLAKMPVKPHLNGKKLGELVWACYLSDGRKQESSPGLSGKK